MAYNLTNGVGTFDPTAAPLPATILPFQPESIVSGFLSGAGTGAAAGSAVPGIGTVIGGVVGAVGGLIGSIFGGGPDTPTEQQQVIDQLRAFFPDQNSPICGIPIQLSALNGGSPLWANVPCSDPTFGGTTSRSSLEWWIKNYGLGPFLAAFQPFLSTSPGGQQAGQAGQGSSPTAGLDTQLGNLTNVLTGVAGAITGAIDAQTSTATAGVGAAVGAIQHTLDVYTSGLSNLQSSIGGTIVSGIGGLLDSLFNPSGSVIGAITSAIDGLANEQTSVFGQILSSIERDIANAEQGFLGLGISLADILKNLWKQLPTILVQVLGAEIPGLKDIVHVIEVLTGTLPGKSKSGLGQDNLADIFARLASAAESIAGTTGVPSQVVYRKLDSLASACSREESLANLDKWLAGIGNLPCFVQDGIKGLGVAFAEIAKLVAWFEQNEALGEEVQNQKCPLVKLPPSTAMQAWLRGFLDDNTLQDELTKQGISSSRIQTLKDLTSHYYSAGEALDMWWRGIIEDDQLSTLLGENGYNDQQKEAAKTASFRITDVNTAILAYNSDRITDDQFATILTANHLDSAQVDLFRILRLRRPQPQEVLNGQLRRSGLGIFNVLGFPDVDTVPGDFADACRRNGIDEDAARYLWWSHFNIGGLSDWISAYYRGRRVYPELVNIAQSFGVTETVLSDLVDIGRPLIPYRTVPAMVTAGIITEDEARGILGQHGFDSTSIDRLIKYATRGSKSSKATTAQAQHSVSLSTARTAYDDGILTKDQYMELLQAHGLDANAAATEIQVADLSNEIKARKQLSTDVVNEYNAGLIDQQTAIQQLATSGLTVAEQAAAVRKMKSGQSVKGKQPSEPELRAWAKADIITPDEYTSRLITIGWSVPDAQHFRDLHFPST